MSETSITIADLTKVVEIDESVITLLASIPFDDIGNLTKNQVRAVVLGDFLITNCGLNVAVTVNLIKHVVQAIRLDEADFLAPVISILDYKTVLLTANTNAEPLFIANNKGSKIEKLPENPPIMILTVMLSNLFKIASV